MKVMAGPEKKSRVVTPEEKKLTAYHEAGHAVAGFYCKHHPRVHEITIIPRGQAGGYTMYLPEKDRSYVTKGEMFEDIVSSLGGRVAEQLILEDISTGASNDLQQATNIARQMITKYGFSERLGPVVYGTSQEETFLGRDFGQGKGYSPGWTRCPRTSRPRPGQGLQRDDRRRDRQRDARYHRRGLRDLPPHPDRAHRPAACTGTGPDGA